MPLKSYCKKVFIDFEINMACELLNVYDFGINKKIEEKGVVFF